MAKKIFALMAVVCVALAAVVFWFRFQSDRTGPEIRCDNADLLYTDDMSDSDLLKNVSAYDEKDGDVTDTLAVESVYPVDDTEVCVVYVAKDSSNNITKAKKNLGYGGDSGEKMGADPSSAQDADVLNGPEVPDESEASDTNDGLNSSEEEQSDGLSDTASSDEAEQARAEQEAAADAMPAQSPRIYLTDYVVKVPVGTTVDRLSYVKEITDDADNVYDLWTKIQIQGTLDTLTPGTYECTYYVVDSQGNTSNQAVLKYIVE